MDHNLKEHKLLTDLTIGQRGEISGFAIENVTTQRLLEMGLTPGETVEVIRFAPMGDPIEILVKGYLLSLRRDEAELIEIHKE